MWLLRSTGVRWSDVIWVAGEDAVTGGGTRGCITNPLLSSAADVHFGTAGHDIEKLLVSSLADHERIGRAWFAGFQPVELGLDRVHERMVLNFHFDLGFFCFLLEVLHRLQVGFQT